MPRVQNRTAGGAFWAANVLQQAGLSSVNLAMTTAATTQATGTALTYDYNVFTTVGASTGGTLPANYQAGDSTYVSNSTGTNALLVWPPLGGSINGLATNAGYTVAINKSANFIALSPLVFVAEGG